MKPLHPFRLEPFLLASLVTVVLVFCDRGHSQPSSTGAEKTIVHPRPAANDELLARIPQVLQSASEQTEFMLGQLRKEPKLPRTFEGGQLKTIPPEDWTSGFFPGTLWYLYEFTGDAKWKNAAADYTKRLQSIQNFRGNHDVGFMLYCSYGNALRLAPDPAYRAVLVQGARSLCTRYSPQVGLIRSWDFGAWKYAVIIDNMMNLELLTWAARETGEPGFKDIAVSHADKTMANHFRSDASSYHVVDYDPATGAVRGRQTHQGFSDSSAWARGQAWGLYGYTMMFRETGNTNYLEQAKRIARFIMNHPRLPADKIPYWDFDAPDIPNAPRDASAAAIMASALIELSGQVDADFGKQCLRLARQQLLSLSSPSYLAKVGENGGFILEHSTGHKPKNSEVDVPLNYADYYFLEALLRYRARVGDEKTSLFIDNGTVRVGIDRSKGGAITWLSASAYPKNMVNLADPGRLIQQSYYSGRSIDRIADGQSQAWSPWPWNPIQGGGAGSWARVTHFERTSDNVLHSETIPKLWDMPDESAAAVMRQWTSFEPGLSNVIDVRCEFQSQRIDTDRWGVAVPRSQEVPACYFTRNFSLVKSYLGDGQWRIETQPPGPPWGHATPPRKSMAFFNAQGQGIAVFSPVATEAWNFGPHGDGDTDQPTAAPCMHVAPLDRVRLGGKAEYKYRYWLVVGTAVEIAAQLDALSLRYGDEKAALKNEMAGSPLEPKADKPFQGKN